MWQGIWQKLLAQAEKDNAWADQVRRSLEIHIGDLNTSLYKAFVAKRQTRKAAPIFVGPFRVCQKNRKKY